MKREKNLKNIVKTWDCCITVSWLRCHYNIILLTWNNFIYHIITITLSCHQICFLKTSPTGMLIYMNPRSAVLLEMLQDKCAHRFNGSYSHAKYSSVAESHYFNGAGGAGDGATAWCGSDSKSDVQHMWIIKNVTNYNSFFNIIFPFNLTPIQIRRNQEKKLLNTYVKCWWFKKSWLGIC
jgi:hypothetical protein